MQLACTSGPLELVKEYLPDCSTWHGRCPCICCTYSAETAGQADVEAKNNIEAVVLVSQGANACPSACEFP